MARIISGTAAVTNGSDIIVFTGDVLSAMEVFANSLVVLGGNTYFAAAEPVIDTTHLRLSRNYGDANNAAIACDIYALTAEESEIVRLNQRTATLLEQYSTFDANTQGLFYILQTASGDPLASKLTFDNTDPSLVTEINLNFLDANVPNRRVDGLMGIWASGTSLIIRSIETTAYVAYRLSAPVVINAGFVTAEAVEYLDSDGIIGEGEQLSIAWFGVGSGINIDYSGVFSTRALYDDAIEGKIFASIDGAGGLGGPTVLYVKESNAHADWSSAIPFQGEESKPRVAVTVWDPGNPGASELVWQGIIDVIVTFPANLNGINTVSRANAGVAPTLSAVYSIRKNNVQFATLTFASGANVGTFAGTLTTFAAGDVLSVIAPTTRDATLSKIAITIAGNR